LAAQNKAPKNQRRLPEVIQVLFRIKRRPTKGKRKKTQIQRFKMIINQAEKIRKILSFPKPIKEIPLFLYVIFLPFLLVML
jgi:hypothetical protein